MVDVSTNVVKIALHHRVSRISVSVLEKKRSHVTVPTFGMVAWAFGARGRGQSLFTFVAAKRAVVSSLTVAGLVSTVLGIVNGWSWLWFHMPAPSAGTFRSNARPRSDLLMAETAIYEGNICKATSVSN
jgi:hypothetical protein